MHKPVLLHQVIDSLCLKKDDFVIDATINGGGHSKEILKHIPNGKLLGIDWDKEAVRKLSESKFGREKNVILANGNYADIPSVLEKYRLGKADKLLADLGFSYNQIEAGRGFSFKKEFENEPLIMTYSEDVEPAYSVIKRASEDKLAEIIKTLGGERFARRIAKEIKKRKPPKTSGELKNIIISAIPAKHRHRKIHLATKVFQAIRIFVNDELENLKSLLESIDKIIDPSGIIAIISFHSLEDKIVKNYFRNMENEGIAEIMTKKPIVPDEEEIRNNPRSRSAKLRVIKMVRKSN